MRDDRSSNTRDGMSNRKIVPYVGQFYWSLAVVWFVSFVINVSLLRDRINHWPKTTVRRDRLTDWFWNRYWKWTFRVSASLRTRLHRVFCCTLALKKGASMVLSLLINFVHFIVYPVIYSKSNMLSRVHRFFCLYAKIHIDARAASLNGEIFTRETRIHR